MSETERLVEEAARKVFWDCDDVTSCGVLPEHASDFVQYLNENGFDLVPRTIIGRAGWTPQELKAYQAGVMWERWRNSDGTLMDKSL